ncbi:two component transcriptional regulator, LuxR family [Granulicella rosea]|uniref:Two component transcriptional regulator, LuxR family n=1 Tax=Granulicella rosea TaxID=474952 RepID=A0A239J5K2_9BACT|nr:response regulator transcription factor [Granulicella rosea]SNT00533.1 two component transcriptional regulator, LuxR family [Granulicella rosea]
MEAPPVVLKRIGVVATDPLRILGLQTVLAKKNIEVVPLSAPRALDTEGVSIVLVDEDATEGHLLELLAAFSQRRPRLRVIVMAGSTEFDYIERVIGAGAKGYISHKAREGELEMAIDIVEDGSVWAPRKVMARLVASSRESQDAASRELPKFTVRETEVLHLLVSGKQNRAIAETLGVDAVTIKAHVGRIMRKVGVETRLELTLYALERGIGKSENVLTHE